MPGKVKVRILSGRNLPVMDRSSDTTDAFCEVRLGLTTFKTDVCRKSLNPVWNSEWFRFDVDDLELQDEPLTIRIMDYDTYSANDAIGKVYIDLNPLLWPSSPSTTKKDSTDGSSKEDKPPGGMMCGWLPIFDTMNGVRGEVNVQVKVELFSDLNRFRQSSCGVQFFRTSGIPEGYRVQFINGFVEELVMNDDPEYQWIDKIRTPRASNEARQTLFLKLSGIIQRKIGLKALELGGNAVLGYQQKFDLESDNIVVRGIGTAVTLSTTTLYRDIPIKESHGVDLGGKPDVGDGLQRGGEYDRPSPDQDLGCSPRGYNLMHVTSEKQFGVHKYSNRVGITQESLELLECPFITLKRLPKGFIHRFGGYVSCRSVKLLEGLQEDDDTRDIWWQDTRREVRSHARSLGCNIIVGYTEDTVICEDIIILCASGTAVVGNLSFMLDLESVGIFGPPFKPVISGSVMRTKSDAGYFPTPGSESGLSPPLSSSLEGPTGPEGYTQRHQCSLVHIPYADISLPYAFRVIKCKSCARGPVPDVLFCTVEPPPNLEITGRGCLMQATVVRLKKDLKAENNAREVSDALPFVEYEIHRQLLNKMRVKGMNALFGLKVNIDLNDRTIVAVATATGFFVAALPSPRPPKLQQARGGDDQYLQKMQLRLEGKFAENLKYYGIERSPKTSLDSTNGSAQSEANEDSDTDLDTEGHEADLASGNKDTCVLEIDDSEDVDILDSLMEYYPPPWIQVMSTEEIVGISPGHIVKCCQTFTQLVQQKISPTSRELSTACRKLMSSLYFKLRRMKPCILCSINFRAELNEENELLMAIYGSVICLSHDGKTREELAKELESLDFEDTSSVKSNPVDQQSNAKKSETYQSAFKTSGRNYFYSDTKDGQHTINLTPLSYVPGAKIEKYLGSLNFFLIRETSGLREAGGINSFVQSFICEIYSIVRSHVSALGGNALVSFFISDLVVMPSLNKNQAQCLVHAGGDAVQISYLPPIEANAKT